MAEDGARPSTSLVRYPFYCVYSPPLDCVKPYSSPGRIKGSAKFYCFGTAALSFNACDGRRKRFACPPAPIRVTDLFRGAGTRPRQNLGVEPRIGKAGSGKNGRSSPGKAGVLPSAKA